MSWRCLCLTLSCFTSFEGHQALLINVRCKLTCCTLWKSSKTGDLEILTLRCKNGLIDTWGLDKTFTQKIVQNSGCKHNNYLLDGEGIFCFLHLLQSLFTSLLISVLPIRHFLGYCFVKLPHPPFLIPKYPCLWITCFTGFLKCTTSNFAPYIDQKFKNI